MGLHLRLPPAVLRRAATITVGLWSTTACCVPQSASDSASASTPTSQAAAAPESASAAPSAGSGDPQTREAKTARLNEVFRTGEAIHASIKVGAPLDALRALARTTPDVVLEESPGKVVCTLAGDVTFFITTDAQGTILGYSSSGYGALCKRLGVDFAGNEYLEGN